MVPKLTDSCFDASASNSVENWYVYSTTSGTTNERYTTNNDIVSDSSDNLIEQFSFIISTISTTNANRFSAQIISIKLSIISSPTVGRVCAPTLTDETECYRSNSI